MDQRSPQISALIFSVSEWNWTYITLATMIVMSPSVFSLVFFFLIGVFELKFLYMVFFLFQPLSSLGLTTYYYLSRFLVCNRHDRAKRVIQWLSNSDKPIKILKQAYLYNRLMELISLNIFLTVFTILWVGAYTLLKISFLPSFFHPNFLSQGAPIPCEGEVGFRVVFGSWFYLGMMVILGYSFLSITDFLLSLPLIFFPNSGENRENWILLIKVFCTLTYLFCIDGIFPYLPKFYRPPLLVSISFSKEYSSFFWSDPAFANLGLVNPYSESGLFKIRSIIFPVVMLYFSLFDLSFLNENPLWFSFNEGLLLFSPQDTQAWMVDTLSIDILVHLLGYSSKMTIYQMLAHVNRHFNVNVSRYAFTLTLKFYPHLSGSLNLFLRHKILEEQLKIPISGSSNFFLTLLNADVPIFILINFFELSMPSPVALGLGNFKHLGEDYRGLIEGVKAMLLGAQIVPPLVKASSFIIGGVYLLFPLLLDFYLSYILFDKFN